MRLRPLPAALAWGQRPGGRSPKPLPSPTRSDAGDGSRLEALTWAFGRQLVALLERTWGLNQLGFMQFETHKPAAPSVISLLNIRLPTSLVKRTARSTDSLGKQQQSPQLPQSTGPIAEQLCRLHGPTTLNFPEISTHSPWNRLEVFGDDRRGEKHMARNQTHG